MGKEFYVYIGFDNKKIETISLYQILPDSTIKSNFPTEESEKEKFEYCSNLLINSLQEPDINDDTNLIFYYKDAYIGTYRFLEGRDPYQGGNIIIRFKNIKPIKEAMNNYFKNLNNLYQEKFNTKPTASFDESLPQEFFISKEDEDGEAEWQPIEAKSLNEIYPINQELKDFYESYYYLSLAGNYGDTYYFNIVTSEESANKNIKLGLKIAEEYFPGKNYFYIGHGIFEFGENDDILLFYIMNSGFLFRL